MQLPESQEFTKEDLYGKPLHFIMWGFYGLVPPFLSIYVSENYSLYNQQENILLLFLLSSYLLCVAILIKFFKKLMPWYKKALSMTLLGIFALPIPLIFLLYATTIYFNAVLDKSPSIKSFYVVENVLDTRKSGDIAELVSEYGAVVKLNVNVIKPPLYKNAKVEIFVKSGFFEFPWIEKIEYSNE